MKNECSIGKNSPLSLSAEFKELSVPLWWAKSISLSLYVSAGRPHITLKIFFQNLKRSVTYYLMTTLHPHTSV